MSFRSDGGCIVSAARRTFTGAARVARIFTAMAGHFGQAQRATAVDVNGAPGLLLDVDGGTSSVMAFTLDAGRIKSIDVVRNPEKLRLSAARARDAGPARRAPHR
ncbi:MAG: hypothetical protein ACXVRH_15480 [Thermoleophilaceae bacterium]